MRIEELPKLPKLFRVIEVDLDVLRNGIGSGCHVINFALQCEGILFAWRKP